MCLYIVEAHCSNSQFIIIVIELRKTFVVQKIQKFFLDETRIKYHIHHHHAKQTAFDTELFYVAFVMKNILLSLRSHQSATFHLIFVFSFPNFPPKLSAY